MIELTINDLFQRCTIEDGGASIYVVRDKSFVYYVGQSKGQTGVIGRLDAHFWLQRRAAGNYLPVLVGIKTAPQAAAILKGHFKDSQPYSEKYTTLHVWMTGLEQLTKLARNKKLKWSTTDTLGQYVLKRLPESGQWQIQLLTVGECKLAIDRYVVRTRAHVRIDIDTAERILIYELHP